VFFFYLLVFTLTIPNHAILARQIGPLTVLKYLGIVCLLTAAFEMFRTARCPPLSRLVHARWFLIYFCVAFTSCLMRDGTAALSSAPFMYTISTLSLFVVTTTLVCTRSRLRWAVLIELGSVAWGSLYVIRQWQHFHNVYRNFRAGGLAGDPNYYAVTVVLWVPLIILWLMSNRPRREKWFCAGCLVVILTGFIFAASRGGLVGLFVALLFLISKTRRRVRNLALVGLLMIPMFLVPGQSAFHRLMHPSAYDDESSQFRLELWQAAVNTFRDHPLFGVGMGHYRPSVTRNGAVLYLPFHVAHNTYLGLIADLGLAGIIPFLGIFVSAFMNLRQVARRNKAAGHVFLYQIALGLQAGLLGYMVCAFFLSTLWQQVFWFQVFLSMCLPRIEGLVLATKQGHVVANGSLKWARA